MARKGRRWFSNDPTVHRPGYFWLSAAGLLLMIRTGVQTCRTALAKRLPKRAGRQTTRHDSRSTTSGPHLSVTGSDLRSSGQPDRTEERVQKSQVPASSSILPQIPRRPAQCVLSAPLQTLTGCICVADGMERAAISYRSFTTPFGAALGLAVHTSRCSQC
jgi:hypothetical protein